MKYMFLCMLLVCGLLAGCGGKTALFKAPFAENTDSARLYIHLQAIDLSEDVATVSSGNDEIVLLLYAADTLKPLVCLLQTYLIRDSQHRDTTLAIPDSILLRSGKLSFWLLEIDSERTLKEIELLIRNKHQLIQTACRTGNTRQLQQYLSDEDLLGFREVWAQGLCCEAEWHLTGIHLFDRYHYHITLTRRHN